MIDNENVFCFCATYEEFLNHKNYQSEIVHMYIWRPNYFQVSVPFHELNIYDQRSVVNKVQWYLASMYALSSANQISGNPE